VTAQKAVLVDIKIVQCTYRPYGVPWPLWDGVGGDEVINETDRLGVIGYLCKYYYSDNLPGDVCA